MTQTTPTPATHARTIAGLHALIAMLSDFADLPAPWVHMVVQVPAHDDTEVNRVGWVLDWASLHDGCELVETQDVVMATVKVNEDVRVSLQTVIEGRTHANRYVK